MNKKLKTVSLFSGIGSFEKAGERVGLNQEIKAYSEIDKWASTSYSAIHGISEDINMGDILKINPLEVPSCDLITHGSPCFRKGTLITTSKGLKEIENIKRGDLVLTHKNRFKKVVTPMTSKASEIYELETINNLITNVTPEHPYYFKEIKKSKGKGKSPSISRHDVIKKAKWKPVREIQVNDLIGFPINNLSENPYNLTKKEAWLIGRYISDTSGYVSNYFPLLKYFYNKKLHGICKDYEQSDFKEIPLFIYSLPRDILQEFLNGYLSYEYALSSNNNILFYGLSQILAKLFLTQNKKYSSMGYLSLKEIGQDEHIFIDEGFAWFPVKGKKLKKTNETVYNFEVEDDNSYTANNLTVHNCQDFSVAGEGKGGDKGSGTRSSLMWVTTDIIKHKKPKFVIWENVKGVLFKKHRHNFNKYLEKMDSLGYNNYHKVLNSEDYRIPQSRERVFVVSIRKDIDNKSFKFPKPLKSDLRLKSLLEESVDKKYYIDNSEAKTILDSLAKKEKNSLVSDTDKKVYPCISPSRKEPRQNGRRFKNNGEPMFTITSADRHGVIISSPCRLPRKLLQVGLLDIKGSEQIRRVYHPEGLCPTINTMQGGNRQPKILCESLACKKQDKKNYAHLYCKNSVESAASNYSLQASRVYEVRKLTPLECWRLMGFSDNDYFTAKKALEKKYYNGGDRSNSQMYKQAGNSIVVNVLEEIYKVLFEDYLF